MKKFMIFLALSFMLFAESFTIENIIENAEDNTTIGWSVYDNSPAGATISNVIDAEQGRVIALNGVGTYNGYMLGNWGSNGFKLENKNLSWKMKYDEIFSIYVIVKTEDGNRYLWYTAEDDSRGLALGGYYIHHGLGADAINGQWQTFSRDLEADLQEYLPTLHVLEIKAFLVRGSGYIDDIIITDNISQNLPVITLNGESYIHLRVGDSYEDAGATAKDNADESDITDDIVIHNPVDTTKAGQYVVSYNVTDSIGNRAKEVYRIVRVSNKNLLEGKNPNVKTLNGYMGYTNLSDDSHTDDGSGSIKIVSHWYTHSIKTPTFTLKKGKHYTIGAYMKAVGLQKGQNVMVKISRSDNKYPVEMNWNISKPGEWEEIVIPYIAPEDGRYWITIFTYRYAITTDGEYAKEDGSNLDRNTTIYFDDFRVVESEGIDAREPYTKKDAYESSNIRIDALGNWSVKENGVWKDIFPKFAYQDWSANFSEAVQRYKEYGFTGITNITSMEKLNTALAGGLKYNGIQINGLGGGIYADSIKSLISDIENKVNNGELNQTSILMYDFDNEGIEFSNFDNKKSASDWITENDFDDITQSRARPIYMLNGVAEGVTRNYNELIDATGSYVYQSGEANNIHHSPVNTLEILQKTQNQKTPVSIMQLQCYYHDLFVPSIFAGIANGAKGLNFWRGGTYHNGCKYDFRDNVWAPAIKGEDGVFARIDKMLPIIKEPLLTYWSASVDTPSYIVVGTRDHEGKHYLILSNFSSGDLDIHITLNGAINARRVKDYFTGGEVATVSDGGFDITIKHHNNGYLVLELE